MTHTLLPLGLRPCTAVRRTLPLRKRFSSSRHASLGRTAVVCIAQPRLRQSGQSSQPHQVAVPVRSAHPAPSPSQKPAVSWGIVSALLVIAVGALQLSRQLLSKHYAEEIAESERAAWGEANGGSAADGGGGGGRTQPGGPVAAEEADELAGMSPEQLNAVIQQTREVATSINEKLVELQTQVAARVPEGAQPEVVELLSAINQVEGELYAMAKGAEAAGELAARSQELQWGLYRALKPHASEDQLRPYGSLLSNLCLQRQLLLALEARQAVVERMESATREEAAAAVVQQEQQQQVVEEQQQQAEQEQCAVQQAAAAEAASAAAVQEQRTAQEVLGEAAEGAGQQAAAVAKDPPAAGEAGAVVQAAAVDDEVPVAIQVEMPSPTQPGTSAAAAGSTLTVGLLPGAGRQLALSYARVAEAAAMPTSPAEETPAAAEAVAIAGVALDDSPAVAVMQPTVEEAVAAEQTSAEQAQAAVEVEVEQEEAAAAAVVQQWEQAAQLWEGLVQERGPPDAAAVLPPDSEVSAPAAEPEGEAMREEAAAAAPAASVSAVEAETVQAVLPEQRMQGEVAEADAEALAVEVGAAPAAAAALAEAGAVIEAVPEADGDTASLEDGAEVQPAEAEAVGSDSSTATASAEAEAATAQSDDGAAALAAEAEAALAAAPAEAEPVNGTSLLPAEADSALAAPSAEAQPVNGAVLLPGKDEAASPASSAKAKLANGATAPPAEGQGLSGGAAAPPADAEPTNGSTASPAETEVANGRGPGGSALNGAYPLPPAAAAAVLAVPLGAPVAPAEALPGVGLPPAPAAAVPAAPQLRLVSAGAMIPHPKKAETGGEDAFFVSSEGLGAAGVADGVGGWALEGVDPSLYPRQLLAECQEGLAHHEEPLALLLHAHERAHAPGSCTVCLAAMGGAGRLSVVSLGDCGAVVVRDGQGVVFRAEVQEHQFNQPYQMASPRFLPGSNHPEEAHQYEVEVQPGDVLVMGSDGLFDNLWEEDLQAIVHAWLESVRGAEPAAVQAAAGQLASELAHQAHVHSLDPTYRSPFAVERHERVVHPFVRRITQPAGGKLDDISVVVGMVCI